ncbi:hypothetical protein XELAEV_18013128mg [Xenopus laevis]|uniref:Solute carrier family 15 member 1 n=1 Tax=Xenopus laevis TaxID=8355 RepID=A0A974DRJ1_XENLA|nr:hypothetical protein XELAEV_18013128mg [Xenopus laevis]
MGRGEKKQMGCFGYPLSIFFIVINEFCERFSYYGMRAVLVLYFKYFLQWDDNLATVIYHTFVAICYLTPILGAIIADSWLGKFKTIIYLSIVYAVGQVVMAISAIHDLTDGNKDGTPDTIEVHVALSVIGLLLIALGTGGIKPCVAAFGGDQFEENQDKQRSQFFSIFYLSINAGSLLSTIITPILRGQECGIHSQQKCYPLAFGVPAALMVVALVVFIVGNSMYKKVSPQGNVIVKVSKCIGFEDISNKPEQGSNAIRFVNSLQETINITLGAVSVGEVMPMQVSNYTMLNLGTKQIEVKVGEKTCKVESMKFGFGSSYTIIIKECTTELLVDYVEDIKANTIHMALQIPQYFLITAGEVVFSVTGLEFSYSQAPSNMKSVLQAGWLLTVAVGNVIVLIVAGASHISQQWAEYVLFAALLVAVCIIFAVMAYFYTYVDPAEIEAQFDEEEKKKNAKEIEAMGVPNGDGPYSQTKM